jgi:hypothetical protein
MYCGLLVMVQEEKEAKIKIQDSISAFLQLCMLVHAMEMQQCWLLSISPAQFWHPHLHLALPSSSHEHELCTSFRGREFGAGPEGDWPDSDKH